MQPAELPFSTFLKQARAGNVAQVEIDQEVKRILQEAHQRAIHLLTENREKLDRLAAALLQEETRDASRVVAILSDAA